jgi:hypothetical protein
MKKIFFMNACFIVCAFTACQNNENIQPGKILAHYSQFATIGNDRFVIVIVADLFPGKKVTDVHDAVSYCEVIAAAKQKGFRVCAPTDAKGLLEAYKINPIRDNVFIMGMDITSTTDPEFDLMDIDLRPCGETKGKRLITSGYAYYSSFSEKVEFIFKL